MFTICDYKSDECHEKGSIEYSGKIPGPFEGFKENLKKMFKMRHKGKSR